MKLLILLFLANLTISTKDSDSKQQLTPVPSSPFEHILEPLTPFLSKPERGYSVIKIFYRQLAEALQNIQNGSPKRTVKNLIKAEKWLISDQILRLLQMKLERNKMRKHIALWQKRFEKISRLITNLEVDIIEKEKENNSIRARSRLGVLYQNKKIAENRLLKLGEMLAVINRKILIREMLPMFYKLLLKIESEVDQI